MVRTAAVALATLALSSVPAHADTFYYSGTSGSVLMQVCKSQLWQPDAYDPCGSYLLGLIDGFSNGGVICPPATVDNRQLEQIAFNFVKDHPVSWNLPASVIVRTELARLYPCRAKK